MQDYPYVPKSDVSAETVNSARPLKKVTFNTQTGENYVSREAYKTLRTNILFCGSDIKSIVITSTAEGEGKSTTSSELAKSLADSGKKTLLIDADMRKSVMLRRSLRSGEIIGLSEVLSGLAAEEDAIFNTQDDNFDVMFTGRFPPNPVELLGNGKLKELLCTFRVKYDYIIIDAPPLGPVIDAAVITAACDAAILVISPGKARRKDILAVKEQLQKSGTRILGAVINESEKRNSSYKKYEKKGKYYY